MNFRQLLVITVIAQVILSWAAASPGKQMVLLHKVFIILINSSIYFMYFWYCEYNYILFQSSVTILHLI